MTRTTAKHRHLGAYALLVEHCAVLLVRKQRGPYRGCWDLPGGGIEPGETPLDALRREVYEETELRPKIGKLMTSVTIRCCHLLEHAQPEELEHVARIYEATLDEPSPPRVRATDEDVSSAKWMRLDELRGVKLTPIAQEALSGDK